MTSSLCIACVISCVPIIQSLIAIGCCCLFVVCATKNKFYLILSFRVLRSLLRRLSVWTLFWLFLALSILLVASLYRTMGILPLPLQQGEVRLLPREIVPQLYPRQHGGKGNERIKIVIYAKHKTGSSLTLLMFYKHNDFFTVFEPLNFLNINQILDTGTEIVNSSVNCNFEGWDHTGRRQRNIWVHDHVWCQNGIGRTCPRGITSRVASDICRNSSHIAVKVIVMRRIEELYPLMEDGVKVIHLLRDPRGMISSRLGVVPNLKKNPVARYDVAQQYCDNALIDLWQNLIRVFPYVVLPLVNETSHLGKREDMEVLLLLIAVWRPSNATPKDCLCHLSDVGINSRQTAAKMAHLYGGAESNQRYTIRGTCRSCSFTTSPPEHIRKMAFVSFLGKYPSCAASLW